MLVDVNDPYTIDTQNEINVEECVDVSEEWINIVAPTEVEEQINIKTSKEVDIEKTFEVEDTSGDKEEEEVHLFISRF
ncbi:hypothetical protein NDU88_005146 [Pleurodeles waltl]|uniref:Uncharacterized protein n=1 Tax=Pleurodeles waltl TaxID=8319 RepID=A0AAV7NQL5_PLEWA|nr:hypothetical protein NDU88_005146 [Pleurodeles waltl]